jgi:glycosyltransferase involved in cell wall biosynthesis
MSRVMLLSFSDLGRNSRLLRYAGEILQNDKNRLFIIGFDGADIPPAIESNSAASIRFVCPFWDYPIFLAPLLWPLKLIFLLLQVIGIAMSISPKVHLLICFCDSIAIAPLIAAVVSKLHRAVSVFDMATFDWYETTVRKLVAKRMFSLADFRISSTHSMEVILRIGGLSSHPIPDLADPLFNCLNAPRRSDLFSLFGVDESTAFVAVFANPRDGSWLRVISEAAEQIAVPTAFMIVGNTKMRGAVEPRLKKQVRCSRFIFLPTQYDVYPLALAACVVGVSFNPSPFVFTIASEVLEMKASGVPVLAIRSGCVTNFVRDGVNGFLVDNQSKLKRKLVEIVNSPEVALGGISREPQNFNEEWREQWQKFCAVVSLSRPLG